MRQGRFELAIIDLNCVGRFEPALPLLKANPQSAADGWLGTSGRDRRDHRRSRDIGNLHPVECRDPRPPGGRLSIVLDQHCKSLADNLSPATPCMWDSHLRHQAFNQGYPVVAGRPAAASHAFVALSRPTRPWHTAFNRGTRPTPCSKGSSVPSDGESDVSPRLARALVLWQPVEEFVMGILPMTT